MRKFMATMVAFMVPGMLCAGEIAVQGTGVESATPDIAYVTAGVTTRSMDISKATEENNTKMKTLFANLKAQGLKEEEIKTISFSVKPVNNWVKGKQELVGYRVSNLVRVTVCDFDKIQDVLGVCVEAGANRIGNISFDVADKTALLEKARKNAFKSALGKVKTFCEVGNLEYVGLKTLNENVTRNFQARYRMEAASDDSAGAAPPVAGGQQDIKVTVNAVFEVSNNAEPPLKQAFPGK